MYACMYAFMYVYTYKHTYIHTCYIHILKTSTIYFDRKNLYKIFAFMAKNAKCKHFVLSNN